MNKGILLIVSGPAGSGKGTVVKKLVKTNDDYVLSISATTRAPRPGEADGTDYFFVTRDKFEQKIKHGEMLEYAEYVGNYYGTPMEFVVRNLENGKNVILEIETVGALQIKQKMPQATLVFLCPTDRKTLEARLRGRGTENENIIQKRLEKAEKELECLDKYDYLIINENDCPDKAALQIDAIVTAEKCKYQKQKFANYFY